MSISKVRKSELIKEYAAHEGDIGSVEVQVVALIEDINNLNAHLKVHKQDHHSYASLLKKIDHRRNLLRYLAESDIERYRTLIKKSGLRR